MELEHKDYLEIFDEVKKMSSQYFNFNHEIQQLYKYPSVIYFKIDDLEREFVANSTRVDKGEYIVKVSAVALEELWNIANKLSLNDGYIKLINPLKNRRKLLRSYLFYLYVDLMLCHEWAHIFCGHLDFRINNFELLSKETGKYDFNKVMELEADAKAATIILARLSENYEKSGIRLFGDVSNEFNAYKLWSLTIHAILGLFDNIRNKTNTTVSKHPEAYLRAFSSVIMIAGEVADKPEIKNQLPMISGNKDDVYVYFARLVKEFYIDYKSVDEEIFLESQMVAFNYCVEIGQFIKKSNLNDYRLLKSKWS